MSKVKGVYIQTTDQNGDKSYDWSTDMVLESKTFNEHYMSMKKEFGLEDPKLVVSVIGDVNPDVPGKLELAFQEGIQTLLKTQDTWLLTDGTDARLQTLVGKAVERLNSKDEESAVSIIVTYPKPASQPPNEAKKSTSAGTTSYSTPSEGPSKDRNKHVKLVGDDAEGTAPAAFIAKLQSYISTELNTTTSVSLMFGGKPPESALQFFLQSPQIPMVVIKGSGGAADRILHLWNTKGKGSSTQSQHKFYRSLSRRQFKMIDDDVRNRSVVVCVLDGEPTNKETKGLKAAVLKAAIDWSNIENAEDQIRLNRQIDLSLALRESQTAEAHIFDTKDYRKLNDDNGKPKPQKNNREVKTKLKEALINNQPNFVKLFLKVKYEYCNLDYFTEKDVEDLYIRFLGVDKKVPTADEPIAGLLERLYIEGLTVKWLRRTGEVLSQLIGPHCELTGAYSREEKDQKPCKTSTGEKKVESPVAKKNKETQTESVSGGTPLVHATPYEKKNEETHTESVSGGGDSNIDIGTHLFLWAVLFNRTDIAYFFWQHGNIGKNTKKHPHIIMALMASTILSRLARRAHDEKEPALQESLAEHAKLWEVRAGDVLMECSANDRNKTQSLLTREHSETIWGEGTTLLSAAFMGQRKHFLELIPCQVNIDATWRGKMVRSTPTWKIFLTAVLPFLIFMIKFTERKACTCSIPTCRSSKVEDISKVEEKHAKSKWAYPVGYDWKDLSTVHFTLAYVHFYTAPITKYYAHTVSYLVFLGLFSYTCLTNLHPGFPPVPELIVWFWILLFLVEECRQIYTSADNDTIRQGPLISKVPLIWWHDKWNRYDWLLYVVFSPLCLIIRLTVDEQNFQHARNAFAITLAGFFFRFLQTFYAFKEVGSKVQLIFHMMKDLFKFGLILFVFVLSYGMAITIIIYPNRPLSWRLVRYVLYSPYWQIFLRESFVNRIDGEDGAPTCSGNLTNWLNEHGELECREDNSFGDALLVIYSMFTNVLLLNVLIAMFNSTFERFQKESTTWWHYNRYSFVDEYKQRPLLAPPLNILSYIFRIGKYISRNQEKMRQKVDEKNEGEFDDDELTEFERINMEKRMEYHDKKIYLKKQLVEAGITLKQKKRLWEPGMTFDDDDDNDDADDDGMHNEFAATLLHMEKTLSETISKQLTKELDQRNNYPHIPGDRLGAMEDKLEKLMDALQKFDKRLGWKS
ncbi:transient receptor potential cation channel subfamily M member-like 2 [Lineus longissimus]|uniref:transient receptor potential cation channel subfamily M member-like 2 n=1 Tax=Lineus longissimus TaxID=88925 RepID=UPI00315C7AE1